MLPYAEQYLERHQHNQWFVRFFCAENDLSGQQVKQQQFAWFKHQGLEVTEVRTLEFDLPHTQFYHVNFASAHDARLKAYSDVWEDSVGASLQPLIYQLYEWSYEAWCDDGLRASYLEHVQNLG